MPLQISFPEVLLTIAGKQSFIRSEEIIYLEAKGSYTDIFMTDHRHCRTSKKLKLVLKILDSDLFYRIHHSYALNLKYLKEMETGKNMSIRLKNDQVLPLSRSQKAGFLKFFKRL